MTDLLEDHVTYGHPSLHASSLDVIVVKMLEDCQSKSGHRHCSSIAICHIQTPLIIWVIILKVLDYFPQKKWLDHLNSFLYKEMVTKSSTYVHYKHCTGLD